MSGRMPAALARCFPYADTDDLPDAPPKKRSNPERALQRAVVALVRKGYPVRIIRSVDDALAELRRHGAAR